MGRYLIIGCGHFGRQAARTFREKDPSAKITVVDKDERSISRFFDLLVEKVVSDGLSYLDKVLLHGPSTDYLIPAVPCHLAFEFILSQLKPLGAKRVKIPPLRGLPNPIRGKTGDLYTSFADFLCPDDCPEPSQFCAVTGEKRQQSLFKLLGNLKGPFHSMVIRSQQLGPGVGGFPPGILVNLIETINKRRASNRPFLISTSCRCHGVTSALSF